MRTRIRITGFACRVELDARGAVRQVERQWRTGEGQLTCTGAQLAVRPLASTPEALGEIQPVVSERVILAYAGRVDNRDEVAVLLADPTLARAADGQVLAAAFEAWGPDFPARVHGDFVFVALARATGALYAGMDTFATRRLYFQQRGRHLYVASDLALLLGRRPGAPAIDPESAACYLADGGLLSPELSMYPGIRGVPAAHVLRCERGRVTLTPYWPVRDEGALSATPEERDEALRGELLAGVTAAMRTQGTVLTDLSGGLDSSTVTAFAARARARLGVRLAAFSFIAPRTPFADEESFQRDMLERYPMERIVVDRDDCAPFESLHDEQLVQPGWWTLEGAECRRSAAAAREVEASVWLSGMGGDQLFCATGIPPLFLSTLLRAGEFRSWARLVGGYALTGAWSVSKLLELSLTGRNLWRTGSPPPSPWLRPRIRARLAEIEHARARPVGPYSCPGKNFQHAMLTAGHHLALLRPRAVDTRYPLLYRPLVELMLRLPWDDKLAPGKTRVGQRRALRDLLPRSVVERTSKSLTGVFLTKGLAANWATVEPLTKGRCLADLGIVEPAAFEQACLQARHGVIANQPLFRCLLSLEAWLAHGGASRLELDLPEGTPSDVVVAPAGLTIAGPR